MIIAAWVCACNEIGSSAAPSSGPWRLVRRVASSVAARRAGRSMALHDYADALHKSLLFYRAQRSGDLSGTHNPIPWPNGATRKAVLPSLLFTSGHAQPSSVHSQG